MIWLAQTLNWLKLKTDALGYSFEAVVNDEHHRQAAANVTIRNIVTSIRFISDVNWEVWFDSVSLVDQLLRTHPNYGEMDFPSRTIYRTAIEELSRGSSHGELNVAQRAIDHIMQVEERWRGRQLMIPGYHLIGPGRAKFESGLGFKPPLLRRVRMAVRYFRVCRDISGALRRLLLRRCLPASSRCFKPDVSLFPVDFSGAACAFASIRSRHGNCQFCSDTPYGCGCHSGPGVARRRAGAVSDAGCQFRHFSPRVTTSRN